jgi:nicotinate-nucleotide adenylyltransferase
VKLGILGGSFNPVHNGHLHLAEKAISELKLDRVVFVPAYRSPFKLDISGLNSSAVDRINMLAASISGDPRLTIDDCEIRREGVSYTVHTLEDIIERYLPEGKPYLLIGDDLAEDFPKWRNSERILEMANIVIARRFNPQQGVIDNNTPSYPYPYLLLNNEKMTVSSNEVREMIAGQNDWEACVPPAAAKIIKERQLYDISDSEDPLVKECCLNRQNEQDSVLFKVEQAARETLSTARFLHSRNTAILAYDMCRRFQGEYPDIDPMDGYLAGIAHDLAKQLDPKETAKLAKSDGNGISPLEKEHPKLLHGRAGAVLLRERFSIHNKDILEAVALHTSGSDNMRPLAKIIYIADKAEVSRVSAAGLRKMCYEDGLNNILYAALEKTVIKLKERELDLSENTLKLLEKMKEEYN